jgi:hypothetical protein
VNALDDLAAGRTSFPPPGAGRTPDRHRWLLELARTGDVGTARLAEAHLDAVAILAEAGARPQPGCLYGVWASESASEPCVTGGSVRGTKRFCSGLGIVDRALVTVRAEPEDLLIDVDASSVVAPAASWGSPALRSTATGDADLGGAAFSIVGTAAWYLARPGFWHGACGPAACWAGAAIGLVDVAVRNRDDDPHRQAQVGALVSAQWAMTALLEQAGREIDAEPADRRRAELRARALRHTIERASTDVADRFSRAFGPRPFVTDEAVAQRHADLHLYLRQHHGERELGEIAPLASGSD